MSSRNRFIFHMEVTTFTLRSQKNGIFSGDPTKMWVTWVTFDKTKGSVVEYGLSEHGLSQNKSGNQKLFKDGGSLGRTMYMHRVLLDNLKPKSSYCKLFFFKKKKILAEHSFLCIAHNFCRVSFF